MNEIYLLEYSPVQKVFHRDSLEVSIKKNRSDYEAGILGGEHVWIPIAAGTWEEMALLGKELQEKSRDLHQPNNAVED